MPEVTASVVEGDITALEVDAIINVQGVSVAGLVAGREDYALEMLVSEVTISTNTAAAGGNAKLMTIG